MSDLLQLGKGAYKRVNARAPEIVLQNRYFEQAPWNTVDAVALLSRPGASRLFSCGTGPIRANWAQEGTLGGDLFTVSNATLYRTTKALSTSAISGVIAAGLPVMAGTKSYLWICDGTNLQFLDPAGSRAKGTLTFTGTPADGDTVTVGATTYTFNTTLGGANSVLIGGSAAAAASNFADAVNADPATVGSAYGFGTVANASAVAQDRGNLTVLIVAKAGGTSGNSVATTETGANTSFGGSTLSGGATNALTGVTTPDDVGIISICVLSGFVLCAAANSERIYFIRPGEVTIDPLDFFSAEGLPDPVLSLLTVGDQVWAFGAESTTPFYLTGDGDAPFAPIQGRAFPQGVVPGTAVVVGQTVVVVGEDNIVYVVEGSPRAVSDQSISERIRKAVIADRDAP